MGDEADFAVIGASYNAQQGLKSGVTRLKWTDFVLGCLTNKADVVRFGARPQFQLVGTIQQAFCIPKPILQTANILGNLSAEPYDPQRQPSTFDLINSVGAKLDTIFNSPLVFEVLGAGFQKPSNCKFHMLRHARVKKLHQDRSWKECISFQELQGQAMAARSAPVDSESQETRRWIERLERKCRRKLEREKTVTPKSAVSRRSSSPISRLSATSLLDTRIPLNDLQSNSVQPRSADPHNNAAFTSVMDTTVSVDEQSAKGMKRKLSDAASTPCPGPKRPYVPVPPQSLITEQEAARPTAIHPHHTTHCHMECSASCILSNTTVYLSPCLRQTPYITKTLLAAHSPVVVVPCLSYWNRASFDHDRLSSTVSESQAYPGMGKIVLVESKRAEATDNVMRQVLALNSGKFQERVEVWDWRVLEDLSGHVLGNTSRRWFLGATILNDGKAVFVWNRCWI